MGIPCQIAIHIQRTQNKLLLAYNIRKVAIIGADHLLNDLFLCYVELMMYFASVGSYSLKRKYLIAGDHNIAYNL